jgi:hypothetical protein
MRLQNVQSSARRVLPVVTNVEVDVQIVEVLSSKIIPFASLPVETFLAVAILVRLGKSRSLLFDSGSLKQVS